jgi:gamma-glutamyltranspeptidase/glutathione hydrolase
VLDFFVAVPGRGAPEHEHEEMETVDIDFSGASQIFHIGAASCAVPGTAAGLEAAHRTYGTRPWGELVAPAAELARDGFELTRPQAYLHAILDLILRHAPEGRRMYGEESRQSAGDRVSFPDLAATLERLAERGAGDLYHGELARALVTQLRESGGEITEADLADYRVMRRRPVQVEFRGHEFRSNPPPSSGGLLIGYALRLLDADGRDGGPGTAEAMARLAEVMRAQQRLREGGFARDLYRGGLARRLLEDVGPRDAPSQTTHISVVDAAGNAASLSASLGSGSGWVVRGTGIHLNNMLGEYDLVSSTRPGARLTSMMAPSVVLREGTPRLVVGSAGSVRLRGAILQIVVNAVEHGLPVEEAIARPRVHWEEPHVHCEGGADEREVDRLEAMGYDVVRWRRRNLYFGGAAAVELGPEGELAAAGDPRRGGAGLVVRA